MKKLLCCLGAALLSFGGVSALPPAPANINCGCESCPCSEESHCGCLAKTDSPTCQCSEKDHCGIINSPSMKK